MTSAKNGDMHDVNVALTSGANVIVHHYVVSILIIVYVLLMVLVIC